MNSESMKISNLKLSIVSILVGKRIKAVPCSNKEVIHNLVYICLKNTARHLCAYYEFLDTKNRT